jgi:glycosyltransferase involved in cell wall biosynthesis
MSDMLNNKRLHILLLAKWYPNDNDPQLGVFIQKHAKAIAEYCNVSVLFITSSDLLFNDKFIVKSDKKKYLSTTIIYFKQSSSNLYIIKKIVNIIRYIKSVFKGYKIICEQKSKPDLVHSNVLLRTGIIALFIYFFNNIPYIITEHWSGFINSEFENKNFLYKYLTKLVVKKSKAVTIVSKQLRDAMIVKGLKNQYYVIPNVIEVENYKIKTDNNTVIILTVADLVDKTKNISGIIKAIYEVKNKYPDIEYHIIGDGIDKDNLKKLAKDLNLYNKTVFFHGRQSNEYVLDFMQKIDFFVLNSNLETFSVVTAEALANGKPVVATRCGGPETFVNDKTGILVEPKNQKQLEDAILYMIKHYKNYNPQYLSDSIKKDYNSKIIGKKFFDIYLKIRRADKL